MAKANRYNPNTRVKEGQAEEAKLAYVPKLTEIVQRLGGFDRLHDGAAFVITDEGRIFFPDDSAEQGRSVQIRDGLPPLQIQSEDDEDLDLIFPEAGSDNHAFFPLHITRMWTRGDKIEVHVSLDGCQNGDVFHDALYGFEVPRDGWQDGWWRAMFYQFDPPFQFSRIYRPGLPASDSPRDVMTAEELHQNTEQFDREVIMVGAALRFARAYAEGNA